MRIILVIALMFLSANCIADERYKFSIINCISDANYFEITPSYIHNPSSDELTAIKEIPNILFGPTIESSCTVDANNYNISIKYSPYGHGRCGADQNASISITRDSQEIISNLTMDANCHDNQFTIDSFAYNPGGMLKICGNTNAGQRHRGHQFCINSSLSRLLKKFDGAITNRNLKPYIYKYYKISAK